jgi:hypothetical protein
MPIEVEWHNWPVSGEYFIGRRTNGKIEPISFDPVAGPFYKSEKNPAFYLSILKKSGKPVNDLGIYRICSIQAEKVSDF